MLPIGLEQSVQRIEFAGLGIMAQGAYASSHAISQWWLPKIPLPEEPVLICPVRVHFWRHEALFVLGICLGL